MRQNNLVSLKPTEIAGKWSNKQFTCMFLFHEQLNHLHAAHQVTWPIYFLILQVIEKMKDAYLKHDSLEKGDLDICHKIWYTIVTKRGWEEELYIRNSWWFLLQLHVLIICVTKQKSEQEIAAGNIFTITYRFKFRSWC